jgi:hypothetical protein
VTPNERKSLRSGLSAYNGGDQLIEQVMVTARACLPADEAPSAAEVCEW